MYSNEDGLLRPASYHQQQPQYVVINPMHIITLRKQKRTLGVRVVEHLKAFSEKWFSHVLLMAFLMLYASLGAILFQWAEAPLETRHKTSIVAPMRPSSIGQGPGCLQY
ncbi:hypothetical protein JTE90_018917 [Oedothorax gibbosus]|uniref:Uncharacterized protein n=1 Tax=Oedothorax gibbosus TaxID=931172 RepID=A0AAV6VV42_9ARAC|nr:hypothetical protein JTE90_018917 [Oedothorax gibbosus]